jgi:formamidopyrimidine-DNA glycosylase
MCYKFKMPELPEVEALARTVGPLVVGRKIVRSRVIHRIAVRPSSGRGAEKAARALQSEVRGERINAVERRGKYLLLRLDHGWLALHFRLNGKVVWFDSHEISGHVDVAFEFQRGTLGFVDGRHLGRVYWVKSPEAIPGIRALGVDPLSADFTVERLATILRSSGRPLKIALLDQEKIAGFGNIYSSEAMWKARVSPLRPADRLQAKELRRLYEAIVEIPGRAIECCLDPAPNLRDPKWWFASLDAIFRVYDREGEACRRCGQRIRRTRQGGRSTFWCPHCQR